MERPSVASDECLEYLNRVGTQYAARRHQTIVAFMAQKFSLDRNDVEAIVRYWLSVR